MFNPILEWLAFTFGGLKFGLFSCHVGFHQICCSTKRYPLNDGAKFDGRDVNLPRLA
jgi:hypothetical protein